MSTALSATEDFPAAPAAVFALMTETEFLQGRMEAGGGLDPQVVSVDEADGVTTVVTRQSIPADVLPSMVGAMLGGDPVTVRTETWQADGDGYRAEFSLVVKGAPASVKGTMTLQPSEAGSTFSVEGAASVPMPMFGAKLETTIVEQISAVLTAEAVFTRARLAG